MHSLGGTILLLFIFSGIAFPALSQNNNYRRHFIIAYDVSSPFISAEKSTPAFKQSLINLFTGNSAIGFELANQTNLQLEKQNGILFFDPAKDEISFFHFNIASSEFPSLSNTVDTSKNSIPSSFNSIFLKDKKKYWSEFGTKDQKSISTYFESLFAINRDPASFGKGVSMSNFVYPLVLDKISGNKYTEEYILILLSDFLTGSMLGNKNDFNRLKESFGYPGGLPVPGNSPPAVVKAFIDELSDKYYRIDFFEYSFTGKPQIGIISYKIKPKAGSLKPEDISILVDNDLSIKQLKYQSPKFSVSDCLVKFTHNKNLITTHLSLKLELVRNNTTTVIFDKPIASKGEANSWSSEYTTNSKLMLFDSLRSSYFIPRLKLTLDSLLNNKEYDYIRLTYGFNASYKIENANSLNYIYKAEKQLTKSNISFSTRTKTLIMLYGISGLALLAVIFFIAQYGRPKRLFMNINGYLDSYQIIDYKKVGKLLTPYKYWDISTDHLPVKGYIRYKSTGFLFNWNSPVLLSITDISIPEGFDIFLKPNVQSIREFSPGNSMALKQGKNNSFEFYIGIRQNDITIKITEPRLVKFSIQADIQDDLLFIKSTVHYKLSYNFHIGPDLGDVWVGLDPGTSGACVTVGSHGDNVFLAKGKNNNSGSIISSKVAFDKRSDFKSLNGEIPEDIYRTGDAAQQVYGDNRWVGFQSVKKLLGFGKSHKEIRFQNGNTLQLTGKHLSGLLVKGLFNYLKQSVDINSTEHREFLDQSGQFNPLRAVVAIPNNFTLIKIQDMVDCVASLNQFKEIRYVSEAEAVLFYYLSNYKKFNPNDISFDTETILVFDMGGATINTTIAKTSKLNENSHTVYSIDLLSKIGYGIGGDTIDYCLIKFILDFSSEYLELKAIDISSQTQFLASLALELKKEIVSNFEKGYDYLITASELQHIINGALKINLEIDEDGELYSFFKKNTKGHFNLFTSPIFLEYIYNNIKDAVKEVLELSESVVNKVIFSGRSSFFPYVKETIKKQFEVKKKYPEYISLSDMEESKTAVAIGACWYGINKNAIRLNNLKTSASFGIKKTLSPDKTDVKFIELVEMGCAFDDYSTEIGSFRGLVSITDNFAFDGSKVNFYQVMGKDAATILSLNQKHKFSKIANIQLPLAATEIAIKVSEDDDIECAVRLVSNQVKTEKGFVSDLEIEDANEEHYTWIV